MFPDAVHLCYNYNMKLMTGKSKAAAQYRYEQAMIDADIEGLARDPEAEALVEQWREDGVSVEDRIERLKQFYSDRQTIAAE